jgi:hypothetical protein
VRSPNAMHLRAREAGKGEQISPDGVVLFPKWNKSSGSGGGFPFRVCRPVPVRPHPGERYADTGIARSSSPSPINVRRLQAAEPSSKPQHGNLRKRGKA